MPEGDGSAPPPAPPPPAVDAMAAGGDASGRESAGGSDVGGGRDAARDARGEANAGPTGERGGLVGGEETVDRAPAEETRAAATPPPAAPGQREAGVERAPRGHELPERPAPSTDASSDPSLPPAHAPPVASSPPPSPPAAPPVASSFAPADPLAALEASLPPAPADDAEEDPLEAALRLQAAREAELEAARAPGPGDDASLRAFYADLKSADQENEVCRILGAFKLNPYEALGVPFDADEAAIRKAYRKASLIVHPDKCAHPMAKAAFELLGDAVRALEDEATRARLDALLTHAREETVASWRRAARAGGAASAAVRVAAALEGGAGRATAQAAYEASEAFRDAWKTRARDLLARFEWRKRRLTKMLEDGEKRAKEEHKEEKAAAAKRHADAKKWEKTREQRVGSWRDFVKGGTGQGAGGGDGKKKRAGKKTGGIRPPKAKQEDADKAYIQRAVGDQIRPATHKPVR